MWCQCLHKFLKAEWWVISQWHVIRLEYNIKVWIRVNIILIIYYTIAKLKHAECLVIKLKFPKQIPKPHFWFDSIETHIKKLTVDRIKLQLCTNTWQREVNKRPAFSSLVVVFSWSVFEISNSSPNSFWLSWKRKIVHITSGQK